MLDIDEKGSCSTCKKPVPTGPSSLTQWIFGGEKYCGCQANAFQFLKSEEIASSTVTICSICEKEMRQADGTMTQWIFQSRYCACPSPSPKILDETDGSSAQKLQDFRFDIALSAFDQVGEESTKGWRSELERYKPLRKLGQGGAGSVFLCKDTLLNKLVAVKFLRTMTSKLVISFQMEAKIASKLDHPGIVKIIDFGVTDSSIPYMVMEPVCGVSLKDGIRLEGTLSELDVRTIGIRLCRSLAYAHRCGTLHRDIKTDNVIVLKDKERGLVPVLIDFGIAKLYVTSDGNSEQSETMAGTPEYMSPDVILKRPYTEASEVYSLGCVLFEALTGRVPFQAETPLDMLSKHTNVKPQYLREVRSDLTFSPEIESIVRRCLKKDPAARFQSMAELEKALLGSDESTSQMPAAEEVESSNEAVSEPITSSRPFSRVIAGLLVLLLCLVGAVAVSIIAKNTDLKNEDARLSTSLSTPPSLSLSPGSPIPSRSPSHSSSSTSPSTFSSNTGKSLQQKAISKVSTTLSPDPKKPNKPYLLPATILHGDSLPGGATQILISKIGAVITHPTQRIFWRTGDRDVTAVLDANGAYAPLSREQLSFSMPDLFTSLNKFEIKNHGASQYLGVRCNAYHCFDKSTKKLMAEFLATRELDIDPFFVKIWCDAVSMPSGYGVPISIKRRVELLSPELKGDYFGSASGHITSLPPPQNGWITQHMTGIDHLKVKSTEFEIPPQYRPMSIDYDMFDLGVIEAVQ